MKPSQGTHTHTHSHNGVYLPHPEHDTPAKLYLLTCAWHEQNEQYSLQHSQRPFSALGPSNNAEIHALFHKPKWCIAICRRAAMNPVSSCSEIPKVTNPGGTAQRLKNAHQQRGTSLLLHSQDLSVTVFISNWKWFQYLLPLSSLATRNQVYWKYFPDYRFVVVPVPGAVVTVVKCM